MTTNSETNADSALAKKNESFVEDLRSGVLETYGETTFVQAVYSLGSGSALYVLRDSEGDIEQAWVKTTGFGESSVLELDEEDFEHLDSRGL